MSQTAQTLILRSLHSLSPQERFQLPATSLECVDHVCIIIRHYYAQNLSC